MKETGQNAVSVAIMCLCKPQAHDETIYMDTKVHSVFNNSINACNAFMTGVTE